MIKRVGWPARCVAKGKYFFCLFPVFFLFSKLSTSSMVLGHYQKRKQSLCLGLLTPLVLGQGTAFIWLHRDLPLNFMLKEPMPEMLALALSDRPVGSHLYLAVKCEELWPTVACHSLGVKGSF